MSPEDAILVLVVRKFRRYLLQPMSAHLGALIDGERVAWPTEPNDAKHEARIQRAPRTDDDYIHEAARWVRRGTWANENCRC